MRFYLLLVLLFAVACSSSTAPAAPRTYGSAGLVPADAPDDFCKGKDVAKVEAVACKSAEDSGTTEDSAADASSVADVALSVDASAADATGDGVGATDTMPGMGEYGPTRKGAEADDDDCKYHVKWLSSGASLNQDVYFQIDVTLKADGKSATHVVQTTDPVVAEVYVDNSDSSKVHLAPNSLQKSSETATPGRYVVGPVRFDVAARWTVRFHLYGDCDDGDTSPHGHVAFLFDAK